MLWQSSILVTSMVCGINPCFEAYYSTAVTCVVIVNGSGGGGVISRHRCR